MELYFVERFDPDGVAVLVAVCRTLPEAVQAMMQQSLCFTNRILRETGRQPSDLKMNITPYPCDYPAEAQARMRDVISRWATELSRETVNFAASAGGPLHDEELARLVREI